MIVKIAWRMYGGDKFKEKPMELIITNGEKYIAFETGEKIGQKELSMLEEGINKLLSTQSVDKK